jgi:hypothetical protein
LTVSYTRPKTRPIQCTHLHFSAWGSLFCLVAIGQTLCALSTVCVQRAMVVLLVAQAQYMDAFVKSSNYFSYVLLFCQEANPSLSLSLSSQKRRERERKHKLLELPSYSLSLSRYSCFKSQEGKCAGLRGFENKGKRKNQPARLFFKLKMLRGDIGVVCSFVYQDKLESPLHL